MSNTIISKLVGTLESTFSIGDGTISATNITGAHTYNMPDKDGTLAMTSDIVDTLTLNTIYPVLTDTIAGSNINTNYIYLVDGQTTITLPSAVNNINKYTVTNVGEHVVTVNTTLSELINGSISVTLPITNMSLDFISDTNNWRII